MSKRRDVRRETKVPIVLISSQGLSTAPVSTSTSESDSDESEVFLEDNAQSSEKSESSENSLASSETTYAASVDNVPKTEVKRVIPAIRPSYFPFVPPYVNFCMHDEKTDELPEEIRKLLKWRLSPITPIVVKRTVSNSGNFKFILACHFTKLSKDR